MKFTVIKAALLVVLSVVTLAVISPMSVAAAPGTDPGLKGALKKLAPEEKNVAFISYKWLRACLTGSTGNPNGMTKDEIVGNDWFSFTGIQAANLNGSNVGVYGDTYITESRGTDGHLECIGDDGKDGIKMFTSLLTKMGYPSTENFLCSIGYDRPVPTPEGCKNYTGDMVTNLGKSEIATNFDNWWMDAGATTLNAGGIGAGSYSHYLNTLEYGCRAIPGEASDTRLNFTIQVFNNGSKISTSAVYHLGDNTINAGTIVTQYSGTSKPCFEIIKFINDKSDDAVKDMARYINEYPGYVVGEVADPEGDGTDTSPTSCAIDGIGWIVCPVINFLAGVADGAFVILADTFLRTDPDAFNTSSSTYAAWSVMRSIANVAFVIVFLIIIFSQMTGAGITNYGVKKMLPRLVVAAILVNVSFFISQLAVDVSNILGYSLKDVMDGLTNTVTPATTQKALDNDLVANGQGFSGIAIGVLAFAGAGLAIYALLSTFIPILLAAVVALVTILFILVARQALIILLVVVSPLAFVAFLLPNTQNLFTQWRKIFTSMLLLFPIIALVFGLSKLASQILTNTFAGSISGDEDNWFGQIIAAAVLVLPFFVVPTLLKKSLEAIPALGQLASKLSSRANGNIGKKLKESYQGSLRGRGAAYKKAGMEAKRQRNFAKRVSKGGVDQMLAQGIGFGATNKAGNESLVKAAVAAEQKAAIEEVSAAKAVIENANLSGDQRQELALTGRVTVNGQTYSGEVMQKAAIQEQLAKGSMKEIHALADASHKDGPLGKFAQTISMGVASNGVASKDPALSGRRIDDIAQGNFDYEGAVRQAIGEGKYTAEAFASMHDDARAKAIAVAQQAAAGGDDSLLTALRGAAQGIMASPEISGRIAGNSTATGHINTLMGGSSSGAPLPAPRPGP